MKKQRSKLYLRKQTCQSVFEDNEKNASDTDIELSAISDNSEDFLSEEEVKYYLNLDQSA